MPALYQASPANRSRHHTRVLIADEHPVVRAGLAALLQREPGLVVCGTARDQAELETGLADGQPQLLLTDLRLGKADMLALLPHLAAANPKLRILVISHLHETLYAERALGAGAHGYLMKEDASDNLLKAIGIVLAGGVYLSASLSQLAARRRLQDGPRALLAGLDSLTTGEAHIFRALGSGRSFGEIAAELKVTPRAVESDTELIKRKLGVATNGDLRRFAEHCAGEAAGLVVPPPEAAPPPSPPG